MSTYKSKDQNWQNGTTTYWFDVEGEIYGVVHEGPHVSVVDCDGALVNIDDAKSAHIKSLSDLVTDEMIAE